MSEHINLVYTGLAIIFALVMTYMFLYNRKVNSKIRKIEGGGSRMRSEEEGISRVTLEKERSGKTGSLS